MEKKFAEFSIGQLVYHSSTTNRGVIFDVDHHYQGTDEWFEKNSDESDSKEDPWYHILVDQEGKVMYVPQGSLLADTSETPVDHPLMENFFTEFDHGLYQHRQTLN